ncbi:MAG: hypothetical protein HY343_04145 [Lentisphaerae bacterium]|nr:hypothetical protein [Lentisphaerota bacterium]
MRILQRSSRRLGFPELLWREHIQNTTRELLSQHDLRWSRMSRAEWLQRKARWRRFIEDRLAPSLQRFRIPIAARLLDEKKYPDFRLRNYIFESLPGWTVGLNLFLPHGPGPFIPVLCPCGHGPKWQDDHQIPPQILARNGFAAALFDMPMFGEKHRHNNHFIQGAQCALLGIWSNFFFLIDALRTADMLETLPDMDFSHGMGVTGVSGGGFATLFLAQLDKRVSVIAPVCSTAPFTGHVIEGLYTGCPENFMTGQALEGFNYHHLVAMAAPRPCLVVGGTQDSLFRKPLVEKTFHETRQIYALEGVPDRLALFFDHCPHKYTARMAMETARWMRRWLMDDRTVKPARQAAASERRLVELLPESDLNCGTALETEGMLDFIRREVARTHRQRRPGTTNRFLSAFLKLKPTSFSIERVSNPGPWGHAGLRRTILHPKNSIPIPILTLTCLPSRSFRAKAGTSASPGSVIAFSDEGKFVPLQATDSTGSRQARGFFNMKETIHSADLPGFGELKPEPTDYDMYGWCSVDRVLCDLLTLCADSAIAQQTRSAWCVLDFALRNRPASHSAAVYGHGEAAVPALLAGLIHPGVRQIILDSFLFSFELLAADEHPAWSRYLYWPDVLRHFDIPELIRARTDRQFLLINPCNAQRQPLSKTAIARPLRGDLSHIAWHVDSAMSFPHSIIAKWLTPGVASSDAGKRRS